MSQKPLAEVSEATDIALNSRRDFQMSDQEFTQLRATIERVTGICMGDNKRQLLYRRLANRLAACNVSSFGEYLALLDSGDKRELETFSNVVTTNLTAFFREEHHFDTLTNQIIPQLLEKQTDRPKLRVWSAGCSTGEEPYSIAMTLRENFPQLVAGDTKILCTDIDTSVLATCSAGIYPQRSVENIPVERLRGWFLRANTSAGPMVKIKPELKSLTTFRQLNLFDPWPMKGLFQVIFCRNVIIYFDKSKQRKLVDRFADQLEAGGYLILGHSESMQDLSDRFELLGRTVYRKLK